MVWFGLSELKGYFYFEISLMSIFKRLEILYSFHSAEAIIYFNRLPYPSLTEKHVHFYLNCLSSCCCR